MPYRLFRFIATEPEPRLRLHPGSQQRGRREPVARLHLLVAHSCGEPLIFAIGSGDAFVGMTLAHPHADRGWGDR